MWTQSLDRPLPEQLAVDHQGHPLLLREDQGQGALFENLDELGRVRWTTVLNGSPTLAVAGNGDVLSASGVVGTAPTDPNVRIGGTPRRQVSVTPLGNLGRRFWVTTVGDDQGDLGNDFVGEAPDGTIWLAGNFVFDVPPPRVPNQGPVFGFYAARLSTGGQLLWERHWGPELAVRGYVVDGAGRLGAIFWVSGKVTIDDLALQGTNGGMSGFLVWFSADGRALEAVDVTEDSEERFDGIKRDAEGRLYVHGWIGAFGGTSRTTPVMTAVAPTGEYLWAKRFPLSDPSATVDTHLAVDDCGDVLFAANYGGQRYLAARLGRDGDLKSQVSVTLPDSGWAADIAPAPGGMYVAGASGQTFDLGFLSRLDL